MREDFRVYMVTNKTHTVLYTGVTNDLQRRVWELTRAKKDVMIREQNPRWNDLSEGWYD